MPNVFVPDVDFSFSTEEPSRPDRRAVYDKDRIRFNVISLFHVLEAACEALDALDYSGPNGGRNDKLDRAVALVNAARDIAASIEFRAGDGFDWHLMGAGRGQ